MYYLATPNHCSQEEMVVLCLIDECLATLEGPERGCPKKAPTSARRWWSHVLGERPSWRAPLGSPKVRTSAKWSLTCVYSDVPDELAGFFESLSTVMAAVSEPTAVNVFLVVPGTIG